MLSPCSGTSDLLQCLRIWCFGTCFIWGLSNRNETELHLWTKSSNADNRGSQDTIPAGHEVSWIYDPA